MVIRVKTWVKILIAVLLLALVYLVFRRITAEVVAVVAPAPAAKAPVVVIDAGHGENQVSLHNGKIVFDEKVMISGVSAMSRIALEYLEK